MSPRIPLSVLELAPVSEGQSGAEAIQVALDVAVQADQLGYRRIWFAQHHLSPGVASASPGVLVALAADRTTRIRVGSGAVLLASTPPVLAAEQFGTVAALHPGRVDLGIGRAATLASAEPRRPGEANPDSTVAGQAVAGTQVPGHRAPGEIVDGLFVPAGTRGRFGPELLRRAEHQRTIIGGRQPAEFRDEVETILDLRAGSYGHDGLAFGSPPVERAEFDLWVVASSGGESARVAGELGLPIAANFHAVPSQVLNTVRAYQEAFRPGVLDRPYVIVSADVLVGDTSRQAARAAEGFADWVRAIRHGRDGAIAYPLPGATLPYEQWSPEEQLLVADRIETRIVGDASEVVGRLEVLAAATGADELLITTEAHDPADRLRSFALLHRAWQGTGAVKGSAA